MEGSDCWWMLHACSCYHFQVLRTFLERSLAIDEGCCGVGFKAGGGYSPIGRSHRIYIQYVISLHFNAECVKYLPRTPHLIVSESSQSLSVPTIKNRAFFITQPPAHSKPRISQAPVHAALISQSKSRNGSAT